MKPAAKPGKNKNRARIDDHPFFCKIKGIRKSAAETPEYLLESDKELIKRLSTVESAIEFVDVVYETLTPTEERVGYADAFFNRVIGWPEGRSYMATSERYREWSFPIVKKQIDVAYRAVFTPLPRAIRALREEYLASGKASTLWAINDGLCSDFARDIEERLGAGFDGYCAVENGNFMTGADGDSTGDDVWDAAVLASNGGLPREWTLPQLNKIDFGTHVWLMTTDGKLHFDAECPEGVECLFDLPLFKRYLLESVMTPAKAA